MYFRLDLRLCMGRAAGKGTVPVKNSFLPNEMETRLLGRNISEGNEPYRPALLKRSKVKSRSCPSSEGIVLFERGPAASYFAFG